MPEKCIHHSKCKFIQYLIDNNVKPDCEEVFEGCNRPAQENPIGKPVDIESYGPQTQQEIKLAKERGLLNTYKNL